MRPFSVVSSGGDAADAHCRIVVVGSSEPLRGVVLGLFDGFDDVSVRPSMPDDADVARDTGVLVWLSGLDVLVANPLFSYHSDSLVLMQSGPLSNLIVPGLPRHSIIRSRLRITGSAAKEKSTSMPRPLRLKSSSTLSHQNCPPSPSRSAMTSEGKVMFGASGTAKASGLSRFRRLRGSMRRFNFSAQ